MKLKYILLLIISVILTTSCEDWLDPESSTEIEGDKLLETEEGFKDGLIGVYLSLGETKSYSKNLSFYFADILVYPYEEDSEYREIQKHQYESKKVQGLINDIWQSNYYSIANINNLLIHLEKNKNVLDPINYTLIKGELHGLRAYLHLDLLRMFGLGNWKNNAEIASKQTIPYVLGYSKDETDQLTYRQTMDLLLNDLKIAEECLAEDPIREVKEESYYSEVNRDGFYDGRDKRMNYFAVRALRARTLMWEGNPASLAEAKGIAIEVIEKAPFKWIDPLVINNIDQTKQDLTFSTEHLFSLEVGGLTDIVDNYMNVNASHVLKMKQVNVQEKIFDAYIPGTGQTEGAGDYRFAVLLNLSGEFYTSIKLRQVNNYQNEYRNRIPLIRISEMYYILAECLAAEGRVAEALNQLDEVRRNRGFSTPLADQSAFLMDLTKEYMREFINEGQFFYFIKRLGLTDPLNGAIQDYVFEEKDFLIPYPLEEISLGNRVQEK